MRRREEGESRLPRAPELVTNLAEDRSGPTAPRGLLQSQIGRRRGGLVSSLRDGRLEHRDTERRSEGSARPHWQEGGAEDGRTQLPRVSRTRWLHKWWLHGGYVAVVTRLLKEVEEITRPQCKRHVVRYKGDAGGSPHSLPIKLHGLGGALLNTSTR